VEHGMFGQPVAVIVHDLRAIQFRELRAETVVKFMQHQWTHSWQNNVIARANHKMESH
jgi:hypothetical protein